MAGISTLAAFLQSNYTPGKLESLAVQDRPIIGLLKQIPAGGENLVVHVDYQNANGVAATLAGAKTRADASNIKGMKFTFDYVPTYSLATIDNNELDKAEGAGGKHSVFGGLKRAITSAMDALGDTLETAFIGGWSDGYGTIGRIATGGISGSTITLENAEDVENFQIDMLVQLFAARTTGAARNTPGTLTVQSIDRENGTVTFTAGVVATLAAAAAGDYIAQYTLREDDATPDLKLPLGIGAWVPSTAPTSGDSFGGKDRSVDPTKLAGVRVSLASGTSTLAGIYDVITKAGKYRGKQDTCVMSFERLGDLLKELGDKVDYTDLKSVTANVSWRVVTIQGPKGPVKIVPSAKCPTNRIYLLDLSTFELHTVNGSLIRPTTRADGGIIDDNGDDSLQIRYKSLCQLACTAPMKNAVGVFAA